MITIKSKEEIKKMQESADILVGVHKMLRDFIKPGISTYDVDKAAEKYMLDHGAKPEQKGYMGYPFATCTSLNDEICHGFPSKDVILKDGDILKVDMVVNLNGGLSDSCWTYLVGEVSDEVRKLYDVTKEALYEAIKVCKPGARIGDIGAVIEPIAKANGFSVVREFVGHGIGESIHEDPQVLHYQSKIRGPRITEGMVFTIEPMINVGTWKAMVDDNGWTARTTDGKMSCQFEHTLAITADGPIILTEQDR